MKTTRSNHRKPHTENRECKPPEWEWKYRGLCHPDMDSIPSVHLSSRVYFSNSVLPPAFQIYKNSNYQRDDPFHSGDSDSCGTDCSKHECVRPTRAAKIVPKSSNIHRILITTRATIFPKATSQCNLLLAINLANPEWISVICNESLATDVVCVHGNKRKLSWKATSDEMKQSACNASLIQKGWECLMISWQNNSADLTKHPPNTNINFAKISDIGSFVSILLANGYPITPVLSPIPDNSVEFNLFTFSTTYNKYLTKRRNLNDSLAGFQILTSHRPKLNTGDNMVTCLNGRHISSKFVCDGFPDCSNTDLSDEAACKCLRYNRCNYPQSESEQVEMRGTVCSFLYHKTIDGHCHKLLPLSMQKQNSTSHKDHFACANKLQLEVDMVDDLFPDCGDSAEDEQELKLVLTFVFETECQDSNKIPCLLGHSKCYDTFEICKYRLNKYNQLVPCRNGQHLQSCKLFECNDIFKCYASYCILQEYVCNGQWECSYGYDEFNCENTERCRLMFLCRHTTKICIHMAATCDGFQNCPLGDDESLCMLHQQKCPPGCQCLALAIFCRSSSVGVQKVFFPYMQISLVQVYPFKMNTILNFENALFLSVQSCNISDICGTHFPAQLVVFDTSWNNVTEIKFSCFPCHKNLKIILLNDNSIKFVKPTSLENLSGLLLLNISNNDLSLVPEAFLSALHSLKALSMQNNSLDSIHRDAFSTLHLATIETNEYRICCLVPADTSCAAHRPWFESCSDLLPTTAVRVVFVVATGTIVLLNLVSIVSHVVSRRLNTSFSAMVTCISCNDLLCAVYLCIVWVADISFRGNFVGNTNKWRSGNACLAAFGISLYFNLLTPFLLTFVSVSRLMVVLHPVESNFKRVSYILKFLYAMCLGLLVIAIFVTLLTKYSAGEFPENSCLPFADPTDCITMIRTTTWLVSIVQTTTAITVSTVYYFLVKTLIAGQNKIRSTKTKDSNVSLIVQLVLLSLSSFLCWVPANCVYLTALFLTTYPTEMITWTTVGVSSSIAVADPLIFISALLKKVLSQ